MKLIYLAIYTMAIMMLTEAIDYKVPKEQEMALKVVQLLSFIVAIVTLWLTLNA